MCEDFFEMLSRRGQLEILCFTINDKIGHIKYDEAYCRDTLKYPVVISKLLTCSRDVLVFFHYFTKDIEQKIFNANRSEHIERLKDFADRYSTSFENEPDFSSCSDADYNDALIWLYDYRKRLHRDTKINNGFSLIIEDIEKADPSVNMIVNVDDIITPEAIIWRQTVLDKIFYKTIKVEDIDKILAFIPVHDRYVMTLRQFMNACRMAHIR